MVWVRYLVKQADLSCGRKRDAEHKKEKAATGNAQERNCAGDRSKERVRRVGARVERERVSRENAKLGRIQSRISPYRRPCPVLLYSVLPAPLPSIAPARIHPATQHPAPSTQPGFCCLVPTLHQILILARWLLSITLSMQRRPPARQGTRRLPRRLDWLDRGLATAYRSCLRCNFHFAVSGDPQ